MTRSGPPQFDAAAIRELVEEVLRRIQAGDATPAPTPSRAAAAAPGANPASPHAVRIGHAVVTLAHIEGLPAGTRSVAVAARAVITPSARDRARDAGIAIVRSTDTPAGPGGTAASIPFVIAQADVPGAAAGRAAAVARSVPQAQRLPATGLADVIAALALHASRDAARGILLTSRPAVALILANRSASLRAVTGRDARSLAAAAGESAANLLVVDPAAFSGSLERLCADFAIRAGGPVPAEFAHAPAGCGCKAHSPAGTSS